MIAARGLVSVGIFAVVSAGSGCEADEPDTHGFIKLELQRARVGEDPFVGTQVIVARMSYNSCLRTFYAENPNWHEDGVDGEAVFSGRDAGGEGWKDRLCDEPEPSQVECEVLEIGQTLETSNELVVRYAVEGALEGRFLRFGPLPTEALAGCADGEFASVSPGASALLGFDGDGNRVWQSISFSEPVASTNQGGSLQIRVEAVDTP